MEERNSIMQAVFALNINHIFQIPFAGTFAEMQTSASGANGFYLHFSLQLQPITQTDCKEKIINYQLFTKLPFAKPFAEILNLPI